MSSKRQRHLGWVVLGAVYLVLLGGRGWAGDSPWYVAARFGESRAEARFGDRHAKWVDDEAGAAAVDIGYQVNRHLAVELGYQDLGSHAGWGSPCRQTDDACIERLATLGLCAQGTECAELVAAPLEADISGLSLALVPGLPLGDHFSVHGKLGIVAWDADVTAPVLGVEEGFSGEDLVAGVGLEYRFPGGLGLQLRHEELDLDVGATKLGLSWRF